MKNMKKMNAIKELAQKIIVDCCHTDMPIKAIGRKYGVTNTSVYAILYNRPFSTELALGIIEKAGFDVVIVTKEEKTCLLQSLSL